jgi:hypothetical protein
MPDSAAVVTDVAESPWSPRFHTFPLQWAQVSPSGGGVSRGGTLSGSFAFELPPHRLDLVQHALRKVACPLFIAVPLTAVIPPAWDDGPADGDGR